MTQYIDPTLLQITPPMDLGRSMDLIPSSLPDEIISPFPLKLRTHNNSRPTVGSVGLFGARRKNGEGRLVRTHDGVDLLAPIGTPVFAVQDGTVASVSTDSDNKTITIEHKQGFRYISFYSELQNPRLRIFERDDDDNVVREANGKPVTRRVFEGEAMVGQTVEQGDRIAEVRDFSSHDDHLHFEIRYPFAQTGRSKSVTLQVDPTWALYAWEKKMYRNNDETRHVERTERIQEISEVISGRMLRFLRIRVQEVDRNIYFPLGHMEDEDRSLVDTLRSAFFFGRPVELVWRESLFFNQIEFNYDQNDKIAILAEVKVIG
jgi:hypothetical protein